MDGNRMLTAEVLALTTRVDRQVTMSTHWVPDRASVLVLTCVSFCCERRAGRPRACLWWGAGPSSRRRKQVRSSEPRRLVVVDRREVVVPPAQDVVGPHEP